MTDEDFLAKKIELLNWLRTNSDVPSTAVELLLSVVVDYIAERRDPLDGLKEVQELLTEGVDKVLAYDRSRGQA